MVASGVFREADLSKKREIESRLVKEVWPKHLKVFEEKLAENNGWLVGDNLTWCDLYLCVVLEWIGLEAEALLTRFANCKVLENRVKSIPKIAQWIRSRPETNL
jgi:glutathione S-transferase